MAFFLFSFYNFFFLFFDTIFSLTKIGIYCLESGFERRVPRVIPFYRFVVDFWVDIWQWFFPFLRQMTSLEDDAYSFGFILLEALVGPSLAASREIFLLKEMVCAEMYTLFTLDSCHTWQIPEILEISIQIEQVFSPLILWTCWSFELVNGTWTCNLHAGFPAKPRWAKTDCWTGRASHELSGITVDCALPNAEMHLSGCKSSIFWGHTLEFAVCCSSASYGRQWTKIWIGLASLSSLRAWREFDCCCSLHHKI